MFKILLTLCLLLGSLYADYDGGSHDKGLTYYKHIFKKELGYDGSVFTAKYTEKEWAQLFENKAEGFKKVFMGKSPKLDAFLKSPKFDKLAADLKAFAIYYAKDSGYSPHCGNNDIDVD